jgi:hypothetical protein
MLYKLGIILAILLGIVSIILTIVKTAKFSELTTDNASKLNTFADLIKTSQTGDNTPTITFNSNVNIGDVSSKYGNLTVLENITAGNQILFEARKPNPWTLSGTADNTQIQFTNDTGKVLIQTSPECGTSGNNILACTTPPKQK